MDSWHDSWHVIFIYFIVDSDGNSEVDAKNNLALNIIQCIIIDTVK